MTALTPPPPGVPVRDRNTGTIWKSDDGVRWEGIAGTGRHVEVTWEELSTQWGGLDMLVPVPLDPDTGDGAGSDLAQRLAEQLLNPVAAMMLQLTQAAGAGVTAIIADAYRRGQQQPLENGEIADKMRGYRDAYLSTLTPQQDAERPTLDDEVYQRGMLGDDAATALERYRRDPLTDREVYELDALSPGRRGDAVVDRYGHDTARVALIDYQRRSGGWRR